MFGWSRGVRAKQDQIAGLRLRNWRKIRLRSLQQGLIAGQAVPVRPIGRHGAGFTAIQGPPNPAHQTQTIRTGTAATGLMLIGRANPAPRLGQHGGAGLGAGQCPSPRDPPSITVSPAGPACNTSFPTI